jgi:arginine deiminase
MAIIVIAYHTHIVDGETVRVYNDSTEKYFESITNQDAKDYIEYLSSTLGFTVDVSEITILQQGDLDVSELLRESGLSKLTEAEKQALGVS